MATMSFNIPDEVMESFNETFANENKSAIVTRLMQESIAQARREAHSDAAFTRILARRQRAPQASADAILRTRDEIRAESEGALGAWAR